MTILIIALGLLLLTLGTGVVYQLLGSMRDASLYPAPGRLIDAGGHRLHIQIEGQGSPAVVLEAGIAASSLSWLPVRQSVARFARVCAYDRAGLGWSDAAATPRTAANTIVELRALLAAANVDLPVILVGHSFGGMVALEFARAHPGDLAGLVLVDPLPASEWWPMPSGEGVRLRRGVRLARRGALLARLGVVRFSLDLLRMGSKRIPRLAAQLSSGSGAKLPERLVGEVTKLPRSVWPVIQSHWRRPKSFLSMADHLESLPASAALCDTNADLGDLPVVVLSAANSSPSRFAEHTRMAARSSRGKVIVAEKSGHWIQLDQPELVVEAIRDLISLCERAPGPTEILFPDSV